MDHIAFLEQLHRYSITDHLRYIYNINLLGHFSDQMIQRFHCREYKLGILYVTIAFYTLLNELFALLELNLINL